MNKGFLYSLVLGLCIFILFALNLLLGSVAIPAGDVWTVLTAGEGVKESWRYIVIESRLPQAMTATLCGGALSVSGLMLQTAFKNPLAGPSVLGINGGAALGVALVIMATGGSVSAFMFSASRIHSCCCRSNGCYGRYLYLFACRSKSHNAANHRFDD